MEFFVSVSLVLQVRRKYGASTRLLSKFGELFTTMPLSAVVESSSCSAADGIFIVHGCPPSDGGIEQINALDRQQHVTTMSYDDKSKQAGQPTLIQELLWSDPVYEDGVHTSERGIGFEIGPDVITRFLQSERLGTVVRSHEAIEEGVELMFAPGEECPEGELDDRRNE